MSSADPERPPRVGRRQFWRGALGVFAIVLFTATGVALFVRTEVKATINEIDHSVHRIPGINSVIAKVKPGGPQTILILGSDHRAGPAAAAEGQSKWGNSDTMMLLRLNPDAPATTALSIPRDLQVTIPGQGVEKINAAYAAGGPKLAVQTLRDALGIRVNHVVDIDFLGFERAVNALHCVYVDVDRRYFNDNNPPAGGDGPYAVINIKAGYQRMCGEDALSYVRFRHLDSDFLRSARQQTFLQEAKSQLPLDTLLSEGSSLLKTLAKQTATDVHQDQWLQVLRLAVDSIGHPVVQIQFPGDTPPPAFPGAPSYVTVTPENLQKTVAAFLSPKTAESPVPKKAKKTTHRKKHRKRSATTDAIPEGLMAVGTQTQQLGADFAAKVDFPVYLPTLMSSTGSYPIPGSRAYKIVLPNRKKADAYRVVVDSGLAGPGHYYGVQGTTWKGAPILGGSDESITLSGRTFQLYYDGKAVSRVAWKTDKAVYWVSNTLQNELSYAQMVGIAKSLTAVR